MNVCRTPTPPLPDSAWGSGEAEFPAGGLALEPGDGVLEGGYGSSDGEAVGEDPRNPEGRVPLWKVDRERLTRRTERELVQVAVNPNSTAL